MTKPRRVGFHGEGYMIARDKAQEPEPLTAAEDATHSDQNAGMLWLTPKQREELEVYFQGWLAAPPRERWPSMGLRLLAERAALAGALQALATLVQQYQPKGSPPPGDLYALTAQVLETLRVERDAWAELESYADNRIARLRELLEVIRNGDPSVEEMPLWREVMQ